MLDTQVYTYASSLGISLTVFQGLILHFTYRYKYVHIPGIKTPHVPLAENQVTGPAFDEFLRYQNSTLKTTTIFCNTRVPVVPWHFSYSAEFQKSLLYAKRVSHVAMVVKSDNQPSISELLENKLYLPLLPFYYILYLY